LINKNNWKLYKNFLDYRQRVDQICKGSIKAEMAHLRHVLDWADESPFRHADKIRQTLPEFLLLGNYSPTYIKKNLATARLFFTWLADNQPGYRNIKQGWVRTIKVKRLSDIPRERESVTYEEIIAIAGAPAISIMERRIRAAAVFLYLSGMRISAFVSLPLKAVDIGNRKVFQYPSMGVRTKNGKYGITYLWDIPELLKVVQEWDNEVRPQLSPEGFWFTPLLPENGDLDRNCITIGEHRENLARRNLKEWLERVGLPYHSPHKFRHGHIHYGLQNAKDIADFKAVSQNAMHSSMEITDQFYSNQSDSEIKNRIDDISKSLSNNKNGRDSIESKIIELARLININHSGSIYPITIEEMKGGEDA
jgi:integrase